MLRARDHLRFTAARAWAWVSRDARFWLPMPWAYTTHLHGQAHALLSEIRECTTAAAVRDLLAGHTLYPQFLHGIAENAGSLSPALARWLVTCEPATLANLLVNPRITREALAAAVQQGVSLLTRQRHIPRERTSALLWRDILAAEARTPGVLVWVPALHAVARTLVEYETSDPPSLWLAMADCPAIPLATVHAAFPLQALGSAYPSDVVVPMLQHPHRPAWVDHRVPSFLQSSPSQSFLVAVVRGATVPNRRAWWRAAFQASAPLTLRVILQFGLGTFDCFSVDELTPYLQHEDARVRMAALCQLAAPGATPTDDAASPKNLSHPGYSAAAGGRSPGTANTAGADLGHAVGPSLRR